MLKPSERRHLDLIAEGERAADQWFADGLRYGHPRLPREYRKRRKLCALVVLISVFTLAAGGALIGGDGHVVGPVLIWLLVPAAGWAVHRLRRVDDRR